MALFHLLQPKSNFQICRLRFSIPRTRFCFLLPDSDNGNPPQPEKEAVEEETSITAVEPFVEESSERKPGLFSKATSIKNEVAAFGGSDKRKTLTHLFSGKEDGQTETTAENEGEKVQADLTGILLSYAKYRNTQSECFTQSYGPLQSEAASGSLDGNLKEFPLNNSQIDMPECHDVKYEEDEHSSPSNSTQKVLDLKDCHMKSVIERAAEAVDKPGNFSFTHEPYQNSNEPFKNDAEKINNIHGLIDFMRQPGEPSNSSNCFSKEVVDKENSLDANLQRSGSLSNEGQRQLEKTRFAGKESEENQSEENKVVVRFIRGHSTEDRIIQGFNSCGTILKVDFPCGKGPLLKSANIYFKTRQGLKNALKKSGLLVGGGAVTVESATSTDKRTVRTLIPGLIGDPDTPAALVKNPIRTIKIEQLTREISSYHIEDALAFCESNVSGYFLGSSESVAYVEFETEIGKERALAKHSINVMGRRLVMLRIDSPRTTVVRISYPRYIALSSILSICRSLGDVSSVSMRSPHVIDVHFGLAEWPNMFKILNRLNGVEAEGTRLQAEPAPVFPPEVLLALWHEPEERKRLKATMQALLHKLGEKELHTSKLASLENVFLDS